MGVLFLDFKLEIELNTPLDLCYLDTFGDEY